MRLASCRETCSREQEEAGDEMSKGREMEVAMEKSDGMEHFCGYQL